ncbi:hypothetical protein CLV99_0398 [Sphingobacterium yanglingense]|uniref:Uncharacterized protein n=1 Tax=Sphingobacterium yanglingense TaxID=1437280 RepID=A0A4R6WR73_9SPHI|nr:hypothetical protein CLV99_0398 [Sphingobacterium yanglingense]
MILVSFKRDSNHIYKGYDTVEGAMPAVLKWILTVCGL